MARHTTLLSEIERDLLEDKPLADTLRKVIMLGGRAGSGEMRDWAARELNGYSGEVDVPEYRIIHAPILLNGQSGQYKITGQQISPKELPDFAHDTLDNDVKLTQGVGELQALAATTQNGKHLMLGLPMAADLARFMNARNDQPFQSIQEIYWSVAPASLQGVLDKIRTKLTQLVAELQASMPDATGTPSAEQASQAVQVILTGKRAKANVSTAQASGGSTSTVAAGEPDEPPWWTLGRRIGAFVVGACVIAGALIAWLTYVRG